MELPSAEWQGDGSAEEFESVISTDSEREGNEVDISQKAVAAGSSQVRDGMPAAPKKDSTQIGSRSSSCLKSAKENAEIQEQAAGETTENTKSQYRNK